MLNTIKEVSYELYKQDWVDSHTTPESRLKDIRCWGETETDNDDEDMVVSYEEYIDEFGYGNGCIYVCFDEFLGCEYLDEAYMTHLLGTETLIQAWIEDITK